MKPSINEIIRNLEEKAAFSTQASIYNLDRASRCTKKNWEYLSLIANAEVFQNRSAQYAKEARILKGIE